MKYIFRWIVLVISVIFLPLSVWADDEFSIQANGPRQAIVGQPFQISFVLNQKVRDFRAPEMANFDVLAGPYTSQSSSTSFINGRRSSTFTLTYTYTIMASKEGTFSIPPATATYNNQSFSSNGLRIEVLPADKKPDNAPQQGDPQPQRVQQQSRNDNGNIFVRTIVSKTKVYEQEAILLTYKLYFAGVDVAQLTNNITIPEFKGFVKNQFEINEIQTELENYEGRNYQTAVLYKTLLFPQYAGDITIEPASFEAILRVQNRSQVRSIFEDFFGSYTNVTRTLKAPGTTIRVEPLPSGKPTNYSGGVGTFTLKSDISTATPKANEAVTIKLEINGSGNMKMIKNPTIEWPEGFEDYSPKVTNNFKNTNNGVSGKKTIEYVAIPRAAGNYTVPSIAFSFFDTNTKQYKTLYTPEYNIAVERGANDNSVAPTTANYVAKEDIKQLGTDIRFINTGKITHYADDEPLITFGTAAYWACLFLPLLIAIIIFFIFRKKIKENANIKFIKYKYANKEARKRLKTAKKLMEDNQSEDFYEEIERALKNYLSDRLSIPTANLNRENINAILKRKKVNEKTIAQLNDILSTAEFARYAPANDNQAMAELYEKTAKIIDKLENKKK